MRTERSEQTPVVGASLAFTVMRRDVGGPGDRWREWSGEAQMQVTEVPGSRSMEGEGKPWGTLKPSGWRPGEESQSPRGACGEWGWQSLCFLGSLELSPGGPRRAGAAVCRRKAAAAPA